MSCGERKVVVLKYFISLDPDILIVENFYENLDANNQKILEKVIFEISKKTKSIQIIRRGNELFSFINDYYRLIDENLSAYKKNHPFF